MITGAPLPSDTTNRGLIRAGQALGVDQLAALDEEGVEGDLEVDVGLDVVRVHSGMGAAPDPTWP